MDISGRGGGGGPQTDIFFGRGGGVQNHKPTTTGGRPHCSTTEEGEGVPGSEVGGRGSEETRSFDSQLAWRLRWGTFCRVWQLGHLLRHSWIVGSRWALMA